MEIKVVHACGSKFAFDIEPENSAMPFAIQCPNCGADATADANAIIAQALAAGASAAPPPPPPKPGLSLGHSAPAAPPPPPPPKPGLSLGRSHAAEAAPPPPPPAPMPASAPAASGAPEKKPAKKPGAIFASDEPHLPLAITGAAIGAAIGMGIWYVLAHYLHIASGWVAWGTGAMAGFGARTFGRTATPLFGIIAAGFTLLAILGGSYLAMLADIDKFVAKNLDGAYEERVAFAKKATAAKDDTALRAVIAEDDGGDASKITDAELAEVKADLPKLRELTKGKPTKAEFQQQLSDTIRSNISLVDVAKGYFRIFTIIFIVLGLSTAFKLGSGMGS